MPSSIQIARQRKAKAVPRTAREVAAQLVPAPEAHPNDKVAAVLYKQVNGWPEWVEYLTPEQISLRASDTVNRIMTPLGWLRYWFKIGAEYKQALDAMMKILNLEHEWSWFTPAPSVRTKISTLLQWEIRAANYLHPSLIAEVVNETTKALGYDDYFYYYSNEEPVRYGTQTPRHPVRVQPSRSTPHSVQPLPPRKVDGKSPPLAKRPKPLPIHNQRASGTNNDNDERLHVPRHPNPSGRRRIAKLR